MAGRSSPEPVATFALYWPNVAGPSSNLTAMATANAVNIESAFPLAVRGTVSTPFGFKRKP
eukprot:11203126-Lingulodinium_polyedra.AAC.1